MTATPAAEGELLRHETDPADEVARAALACDVVERLDGSGLATFLPGRRVAGVRLSEEACEVAVVLRLDDRPLPVLADEVRTAVEQVAGDRRVDVVVSDVVLPESRAALEAPDPYPEP